MLELDLVSLLKGANARARVLLALLGVCGVLALMGTLALLSQAALLQDAASGTPVASAVAAANDSRVEMIGSAEQVAAVLTIITWLVWLHWAYRAMRAMGTGTSEITPGWAVGYWFVPFINLYRPYRTVREVLARSEQQNRADFLLSRSSTTIVGIWWAAWLLSNGLARVASSEATRAQELPDLISATNLLVVASITSVAAAALAIAVVSKINRLQQAMDPSRQLSPVQAHSARRPELRLVGVVVLLAVGGAALWKLGSRPSKGALLTAPEIAARANAAIVQVRALGTNRESIAAGTGFFLTASGLIATNLHVIQDAHSLEVESSRGDIYDVVYFVTADTRRDIAIIKVPIDDASPLSLAEEAEPAVGEQVFVMGNPLGQVGTFSDGLVSAHRTVDGVTLMQITAPISSGSSGGPVMNSAGQVVGLATLMLRGGQNLNYAVPSRYVRPLASTSDAPQRFSPGVLAAAIGQKPDEPARSSAPAAPSRARTGSTADRDAIGPQFRSVDSLVRARGGVAVSEIVRGDLDEGGESTHPVTLVGGNVYILAAYCDDDCSDLDLVLQSTNGTPLQSDTDDDDSPFLRIDAKVSGEHKLLVRMVKCSIAPCAYGIRLYRLP